MFSWFFKLLHVWVFWPFQTIIYWYFGQNSPNDLTMSVYKILANLTSTQPCTINVFFKRFFQTNSSIFRNSSTCIYCECTIKTDIVQPAILFRISFWAFQPKIHIFFIFWRLFSKIQLMKLVKYLAHNYWNLQLKRIAVSAIEFKPEPPPPHLLRHMIAVHLTSKSKTWWQH